MYAEFQHAFGHFNRELFSNQLPECMITLQRQKRTQGYYSPGRFADTRTGTHVDEIAINPSYFALQGIRETMRVLVHQLTHCWQRHHGTPGRKRYHNAEWADKMEAIGLMPSDTGHPGGKRTGESVDDFVIPGGPFEQAFANLMTARFTISWLDRFPVSIEHLAATLHQLPEEVQVAISEEVARDLAIEVVEHEPKGRGTSKYSCPLCGQNAWGKPGLQLGCLPCDVPLKTTQTG
jgi:hypothetical protein